MKLTLETSAGRRTDQCRSDDGKPVMRRIDSSQLQSPCENGPRWLDIIFSSFFFIFCTAPMTDERQQGQRTTFSRVTVYTECGRLWLDKVTWCSREIALSRVRLSKATSLCWQTLTKVFFLISLCDDSELNVSFFFSRPIDDFHQSGQPTKTATTKLESLLAVLWCNSWMASSLANSLLSANTYQKQFSWVLL